ncbi:hypothetical protein PYW07_008317 [Mythimna separata]|uniref:ALMS motif domain-containing protein n=1 Tax=Mythimna separata TaxID=271217 RepID=A0AAD8DMR2_MYTSE|nr:hypothetical protein PYW07_008317 [Mythimna separata]
MENDEVEKTSAVGTFDDVDSRSAVNATILDYYKKFGRKRDLEQFFSLSTAQSEIKDTSGLFWRKMKSENDSSDSGGRKSESSQEVCRISIRCSLPDPSSSQDDEEQQTKTNSPHTESPPIITEEAPADVSMRHTDDESINFDDNNSQKSLDALLDLSAHKPLSPTSSVTSQRKLEWDSLADVGYGNESDRKNSASSLSTLERLALKQQYSNNDTKQDIGAPTSHSTPLDENENKSKSKKGLGKKTTKIYKKDVDFVEVNVPHTSDTNQAPSINVNLTKHISFNVERDGGVTIDNVKKDVSISHEKVSVEINPYLGMDKEVQTSLTKDKSSNEKSNIVDDEPKPVNPYNQKIPVMISLNTLRKRLRRKKTRYVRRKLRPKKLIEPKENITLQERSGEQLSEAESFEYLPGHMYHQNQMNENEPRPDNSTAGNKSSLESSGPLTTDSSKGSNHSLTKDLEKCVELLKVTLQKRYDDGSTKKKLIKDIVRRLISSKYRDDETTTEFLSGLTFDSKKLETKENNTTTSTSDANNTGDSADKKPKKSILRNEKFNPNIVASTSQSAPNLFSASTERLNSNLLKTMASITDSDVSSRGKTSSENAFPKTSSEELYLKYLEALRREEAYKRHLKDKEMFLKQKLVSSETAFKVPVGQEAKISNRLKDLMKDLTRNNYDDGSGDASKLEGGSSSNMDLERFNTMRNQRSHSVFTLSSSHSEGQKRPNLKKKMQADREIGEAGPSKNHYCCCPHHYLKPNMHCVDSSVQVSIKPIEETKTKDEPCQTKKQVCGATNCECKKCTPCSPGNTRIVPDKKTGEIKYVCLCNRNQVSTSDVCDNFMIYKCCKLTNRGVQPEDPMGNTGIQCGSICNSVKDDKIELIQPPRQMQTATESSCSDDTSKRAKRKHSKSSQTNMLINMCYGTNNYCSSSSEAKNLCGTSTKCIVLPKNTERSSEKCVPVYEATRCLQTEISINPKISDPTLSDIVIIDNYDCSKLICENRRKTSIHSSGSEGGKSCSDVGTNSTSGKIIIESLGSGSKEGKTEKWEEEKGASMESSKESGKDYTIPIKGTNMTLTVNLTGTDKNKKGVQVSECVGTEKICVADEATSANEDNKSTQCSGILYVDQNKICIIEPSVSKKSCLSKKHLTDSSVNCNTLPNICTAKEKPPLRRANTDTGKLTVCTCVQTDDICTKDVETNNNRPVTVDLPSEQVIMSDNCYQVEQNEEKTTNTPQKQCDSNNKCDCKMKTRATIGLQKDFSEEDAKIVDEKPKPETNDVGVETDKTSPNNEQKETPVRQETCCYNVCCPGNSKTDPVVDMIKDITRRYSKTEIIKIKKNKCFSEIITVLNYLLETEDSTDPEQKTGGCTSTDTKSSNNQPKRNKPSDESLSDKPVDKSVQPSGKDSCVGIKICTDSSELPRSSDLPTTSSDSAACRVLNKIKKECEKYHQKTKCRGRKCEVSSSTSVNCEKCKKVHHCACRNHKCKRSKAFEKLQKKCIAYNLIIQTSESMLSEETVCEKKGRPLKNIIVKVPKRKCDGKKESPRREKSGRSSPSPRCSKTRSRSCPDECETSDDCARRIELATVREYLEQNRPDFVEKTSERQNCLKFISERRATLRAAQRDLLSLHVEQQPDLTNLSSDELRLLAKQIGLDLRRKKPSAKFISEREMKKHSERIYKTLPEVVQKKEEKKKENIKKTNLLMANMFKKNLQKQALRGSVNLSNYSPVIKI